MSRPLTLHLMNAGGLLPGALAGDLRKVLDAALARQGQRLGLDGVDVAVRVLPWGLPETGVHGYAPAGHHAELTLSPQNPNFAALWRTEVPATLAHELHHCRRWRGPGYGETLLEVLVSEGLAQHHEREERGGQPAPYSRLTADLAPLWARAAPLLDRRDYGHAAWFFGSEEAGLPRWAGYALGYDLVRRFQERRAQDTAALADAPAEVFQPFVPV